MGHIPTYSNPFSLAVLPSRAGLAWSPLLDRLLRHAEGYVWPILSPGPAQDHNILLIPLKCIYLHSRLLPTDKKKYQSARIQIAVAGIKTLSSLQRIKIGQRFLFVRQFCRAFFERNPFFFICFFFLCAVIFFASAFAQCIYGTAGQTQCAKLYKRDQRSHLGKTTDALIIGDTF